MQDKATYHYTVCTIMSDVTNNESSLLHFVSNPQKNRDRRRELTCPKAKSSQSTVTQICMLSYTHNLCLDENPLCRQSSKSNTPICHTISSHKSSPRYSYNVTHSGENPLSKSFHSYQEFIIEKESVELPSIRLRRVTRLN